MKWNNVSLLLLLGLLIAACDSQQPTYSASNANSAPPPPPPPAAQPPPPRAAEPAAPMPVAEKRPAPPPPTVYEARQHTPAASLPERGEALPPVAPIGIGSCDSYIERYRTCVNNGVASGTMPDPSKFALTHAFNRQVRKWQADVSAGNTAQLVTACAEADQQARDELVKAGCTSF